MADPFITALIDTYNHEAFIETAILSVLNQDFPPQDMEILVVDDGSSDRTAGIASKFAPRVRLLGKKNGGQGSAFNTGIAEARGQIVAFLDGDDWWMPNKLRNVANVFYSEPEVGLVGHGFTQIYPDGHTRSEVSREAARFRLRSRKDAKTFGLRRGFLGTSRMAYRRQVLQRMGTVPECLTFEADEYLFTLAGLYSDVQILPETYTFYRLHDSNLFQFLEGSGEKTRRKHQVLVALARCLKEKLTEERVPIDVAQAVLDFVELEAEGLRLILNPGLPWETLRTELQIMRVFHSDVSIWQRLFTFARLAPALFMPSNIYYRYRRKLSTGTFYSDLRRRFLPLPTQPHVLHEEQPPEPSHVSGRG